MLQCGLKICDNGKKKKVVKEKRKREEEKKIKKFNRGNSVVYIFIPLLVLMCEWTRWTAPKRAKWVSEWETKSVVVNGVWDRWYSPAHYCTAWWAELGQGLFAIRGTLTHGSSDKAKRDLVGADRHQAAADNRMGQFVSFFLPNRRDPIPGIPFSCSDKVDGPVDGNTQRLVTHSPIHTF